MSDYSVYKSDGTVLVDLVPNQLNRTATSLVLQGDDVVPRRGGQINPENLLHLLEHFANTASPANPIAGQIWFNSSTSACSVYDGTRWKSIGPAPVRTTITGSRSTETASVLSQILAALSANGLVSDATTA